MKRLTTRTSGLAVAVLAFTFAVTDCGGGGGDVDAKKPTNPETSKSPTTSPPNAADQAIAEASLLTLSDFPAGWEATPADKDDDDAPNHRIAKCVGADYDLMYGGSSGDADSKDFASGDEEQISNKVKLSPDESRTVQIFEIESGEKFRKCLEAEAQSYFDKLAKDEDDMKIGDTSLNELSFDQFGDESIAFRLTIPITTQGTEVDVIADYVFVRMGRATTLIVGQGTGTPIDVDDLSKFTKIATDRLTEKLNGSVPS